MNNATTVYWAEIQGLTQLAGIGIPEKRIRKLETQLETQDNSGIHSSEPHALFCTAYDSSGLSGISTSLSLHSAV